MINNKIDFILTIEVKNANPNGDPLSGNMPRTDSNGLGQLSDVSIKRKIRNRMQDMDNEIFVKSRDRTDDGFSSLEERYNNLFDGKDKNMDDDEVSDQACEEWIDVRSFGQVITFNKKSIGIRGPVSIGISKSLKPVQIQTMQITRSTNGAKPKSKGGRSADTMGSKHFVEHGVYVVYGAVNSFFSEKTGFNEEDLKTVKDSLQTLFRNDVSSARPDGSMTVRDLFWFKHSSKLGNASSAKIHDLFEWDDAEDTELNKYEDYNIHLNKDKLSELETKGLVAEYLEGL